MGRFTCNFRGWFLTALAIASCAAQGQGVIRPPATATPPAIQKAIETLMAAEAVRLPGSMSFSVGSIVANSRIQECTNWQAFLPGGQKPWGRISVGVRCEAGSNLTLFVPVTLRLQGQYVVMARTVSGGQVLGLEDLALAEGELTALPADVLTDPAQAVGQSARQALSSRQPLRAMHLKQEAAILAGQNVRLLSRGPGFSVTNEGRALNNAAPGQLVRVRLANNQVVSGVAREAGVVEVTTK